MSEAVLIIDGAVASALRLTLADLQAVDPFAQIADVGQIDPKRKGAAVKLSALLAKAQPKSGAAYLTLHASADDFHASVPLAAVQDRALLIYSLQGQPLPTSMGGPVRFFIPDFAACHTAEVDECANVKFVDRIELSTSRGFDNRPADEKAHADLHQHESK